MGFALERLWVQLALTMDMKDIHAVVSHSHLQEALWTTGTACIPKGLCVQGLREEQCLKPGVRRGSCHKSQFEGLFVRLEKLDWSILEILMLLRSSSRSTVQTAVQAVCKELGDLSGRGKSSALPVCCSFCHPKGI